jgi:hypothetical protein
MRRLTAPPFILLVSLSLCMILLLSWQPNSGAFQPEQNSWQPAKGKWQPVPPHREDRGNIKVVWLQGTPYEMGYQHGKLLHDEIASLGTEVIQGLKLAGKELGLGKLAIRRSFPDVVEECRGLADATKDVGITMDSCMMVAFGDVYQGLFTYLLPKALMPDGCSIFVAAGQATVDGRLYYGRSFDHNKTPIAYWIENPTVFVRQPKDGIPHVSLAMPGAVWPDSGMNAEGIMVAINDALPQTIEQISFAGGSNLQVMAKIMKQARSYEQARALMSTWERMRGNIIAIADGKSRQAGVFELLGTEMGVRQLDKNGVLYATNHFVAPEMTDKDARSDRSTLSRYERFSQLLEPKAVDSRYGKINPQVMVEILRDRTNPYTSQQSSPTVYDDDTSIGSNGALRQEVYDPDKLLFWVASGKVPIPQNPFVCFSLGEMLGLPNPTRCESPTIE